MAHSFASLYYHVVFSTKDRLSLITPECRQRLYDYLGGVARENVGKLCAAGGGADHSHLLLSLNRDVSVSDTVRILKSNSSRWIRKTFPDLRDFGWQQGYGAFSISYTGIERVKAYIAGQEAHHRVVSFKEEFLDFLRQHNMEYDERYIWD